MSDRYRRENTSVSLINYHLVFCPRYRRKIFLIQGVEDRFKEVAAEICERNYFRILAMECHIDHVHIFVNVPPKISAADAVKVIKTNTGRVLRAEFPALSHQKSLWTRSYFASTAGNVSSAAIEQYIRSQKTRS